MAALAIILCLHGHVLRGGSTCATARARPRLSAGSATTPAAASDALGAVHAALFARIGARLGGDETAADAFVLRGGATGAVRGLDASSARVPWVSARTLRQPCGAALHDLAGWCAPTADVPNLFVRAGVRAGSLALELDFRPRLNAAYERAGAPPASRDEFAQAALRTEYDERFFTPEVRAWRDALLDADGATQAAGAAEGVRVSGRRQFGGDDGGLVGGPLALALALPLTDAAVAAAAAACERAVEHWLGWVECAPDAPWMRNRLVYTRDCQVRQALYAAAAAELGEAHGEAGLALAAAEAGRRDMWGHNLMQEQGAFGADPTDGEGRD